jgi:acetolactate synthase-1/3 small subunit
MMCALSPSATSHGPATSVRRHTVVVQLHDRPGALYRVIGLVRRRDYNVSSLVVGPSERPGTSRMVLVVEAADVHQVVQQLMRLVDVVSVAELAREDALVRETVLAVVEVPGRADEVLAAAAAAGARVAHRAHTRLLLELTAEPSRVDGFVATMRGFDLRQLARTGAIVIRETEPTSIPDADASIGAPLPPSAALSAQELAR